MNLESAVKALNDCGTANSHAPRWHVSMTSPEGATGVEIRKCTPCMLRLLETPAVQTLGRTVHLKVIT